MICSFLKKSSLIQRKFIYNLEKICLEKLTDKYLKMILNKVHIIEEKNCNS